MTKSYKINFCKNNEGATAVEFAIIAFPLFIIMFGIIEFSLMYFATSVIENSTTIGARLGITGSDYSGEARVDSGTDRVDVIRKNIIEQSNGFLDPALLSITCRDLGRNFDGVPEGATGNHSCGAEIRNDQSCAVGGAGGNVMIYTVSYCWRLLTPLAGMFRGWIGSTTVPDQVLLSSSLLVRNERFVAAPVTP